MTILEQWEQEFESNMTDAYQEHRDYDAKYTPGINEARPEYTDQNESDMDQELNFN